MKFHYLETPKFYARLPRLNFHKQFEIVFAFFSKTHSIQSTLCRDRESQKKAYKTDSLAFLNDGSFFSSSIL